jgi:hypothetical protein
MVLGFFPRLRKSANKAVNKSANKAVGKVVNTANKAPTAKANKNRIVLNGRGGKNAYSEHDRYKYLHTLEKRIADLRRARDRLVSQAQRLDSPQFAGLHAQAKRNANTATSLVRAATKQFNQLRGYWDAWPYYITTGGGMALTPNASKATNLLGSRFAARDAALFNKGYTVRTVPDVSEKRPNRTENLILSKLRSVANGVRLSNIDAAFLDSHLERILNKKGKGSPLLPWEKKVLSVAASAHNA